MGFYISRIALFLGIGLRFDGLCILCKDHVGVLLLLQRLWWMVLLRFLRVVDLSLGCALFGLAGVRVLVTVCDSLLDFTKERPGDLLNSCPNTRRGVLPCDNLSWIRTTAGREEHPV